MKLKEVNSNLIFVVEYSNNLQPLIIHAQRIIPYLVAQHVTQASKELTQQAAQYDTVCHLVEAINRVKK